MGYTKIVVIVVVVVVVVVAYQKLFIYFSIAMLDTVMNDLFHELYM
jgi:hypothetical protein